MQINNQTAIITGAASGMGAATAKWLAERGAQVAMLDLNLDALKPLAESINGLAIQCDVSDATNAEEAMARIHENLGEPRICVNCAGIAPAKRIVGKDEIHPLDEFAKVIEINLVGTFNIMRLAAAHMTKLAPLDASEERGVIINTASVAAYEGQIGQAAYSASKGGVVGLTLPAARELSRFGVRVNAIAPGLVATPLLLNMPENVQQDLKDSVPFPKRLAEPDEFAHLVQHIIENQMINGAVLRLDGALRMQ